MTKHANARITRVSRRYKYAVTRILVPYHVSRRISNWSWPHLIQYLCANLKKEQFIIENPDLAMFEGDLTIIAEKYPSIKKAMSDVQ